MQGELSQLKMQRWLWQWLLGLVWFALIHNIIWCGCLMLFVRSVVVWFREVLRRTECHVSISMQTSYSYVYSSARKMNEGCTCRNNVFFQFTQINVSLFFCLHSVCCCSWLIVVAVVAEKVSEIVHQINIFLLFFVTLNSVSKWTTNSRPFTHLFIAQISFPQPSLSSIESKPICRFETICCLSISYDLC